MTKRQSDGASGNDGNVRNNGGRFGRDGNEIWMGFNGKGMEWNMVHETPGNGKGGLGFVDIFMKVQGPIQTIFFFFGNSCQ